MVWYAIWILVHFGAIGFGLFWFGQDDTKARIPIVLTTIGLFIIVFSDCRIQKISLEYLYLFTALNSTIVFVRYKVSNY